MSISLESDHKVQDHEQLKLETFQRSSSQSIHPPLSSIDLKRPQTILDEPSTSSVPTPSSISNLQVDYVIVFSLLPIQADRRPTRSEDDKDRSEQDERSYRTDRLIEEYQLLIHRLKSTGLSVTSRPGSKSSHELLILVTAHNETRIEQEIQAERYRIISHLQKLPSRSISSLRLLPSNSRGPK